jgi:PAS domain S-box-containing protein
MKLPRIIDYRIVLRRPEIWTAALLFATGLVVAALAAATLVAYHHGPAMLSVRGFPPLQYDTAWIVLAYGIALVLYALQRPAIAHVFTGLGAVIGLAGVLGFMLPEFSRNPLLDNPWVEHPPFYARIGVLSALVAVVLGMALSLLARSRQRSPTRAVALAGFASIAAALSLLIVFGAWSGSNLAAQSLQFSGDERISALLMLLLAAAVLTYALLGRQDERAALSRAAPLIVWLAGIACALVVWRAALAQEARFIHHSTQIVAQAAAVEINRELEARIQTLERLADRVQFFPYNENLWDQDASSLLASLPEFFNIAWAGPDNVVRWSMPDKPSVGLTAPANPARRDAVELARTSRAPALSPFADFSTGGKGIVIYVPAFADDSYTGMVIASLGRSQWLSSLINGRFTDHQFDLYDGGELTQTVRPDGVTASDEWAELAIVQARNARWTLRVTPTRQYVSAARSRLPEIGLLLGTALATLLAIAVFLFQEARARARESSLANARLVADVARRQHTEQRLREAESRTQLIINSVKDCAIYMLDTEGRILTWSTGSRLLYGYEPEDVLGQPFDKLYPPDRMAPPEGELIVAARRGWFEEECWHLRRDGSRFCGDDIVSSIRDEDGKLRGFAVVTRDATPRIELREQTERARDHYMTLFSSFPNLVWRSDPEGRCDYVNQAWLEYTGRSMGEERDDGWMDSVHPDNRDAWRSIVERTFPTRQPFEIEFRMRRADGDYGWMICSGRPYHDMHGNFAGYLCSCYDNTARRRTEDALKESEARYQRLTSNLPGMVFKLERTAESAFFFRYVSLGAEAVTGISPDQLLGSVDTFLSLLGASERDDVRAALHGSASHLSTFSWAGRLHPRNEGSERWVTIRARPTVTPEGTVVWDGVVLDDTPSRMAQLELERSREELRALSAYLQSVREDEKARIAREVHDELGATLTGLRIDLDWLIDHQTAVSEPARGKYRAMLALLQSAVASTRKIVTELRPSILDDLGLASALRWQAGEYQKHAPIRFHLQMPEPEVVIDRDRALALFRIFQETITNVTRHAKATDVDVVLGQTDRAWVMQISDNGVGIADAAMLNPTSHGIRGMRERAQMLGGTVSVRGTPGEGTTVIVTLPRPTPALTARATAGDAATVR